MENFDKSSKFWKVIAYLAFVSVVETQFYTCSMNDKLKDVNNNLRGINSTLQQRAYSESKLEVSATQQTTQPSTQPYQLEERK